MNLAGLRILIVRVVPAVCFLRRLVDHSDSPVSPARLKVWVKSLLSGQGHDDRCAVVLMLNECVFFIDGRNVAAAVGAPAAVRPMPSGTALPARARPE